MPGLDKQDTNDNTQNVDTESGSSLHDDAYSNLPGRNPPSSKGEESPSEPPEREERRRRRDNDRAPMYPLPDAEPFVIINANPGHVRTNADLDLPDVTITDAQGTVRPGTRIQ
jgi:hypothetical protein